MEKAFRPNGRKAFFSSSRNMEGGAGIKERKPFTD